MHRRQGRSAFCQKRDQEIVRKRDREIWQRKIRTIVTCQVSSLTVIACACSLLPLLLLLLSLSFCCWLLRVALPAMTAARTGTGTCTLAATRHDFVTSSKVSFFVLFSCTACLLPSLARVLSPVAALIPWGKLAPVFFAQCGLAGRFKTEKNEGV